MLPKGSLNLEEFTGCYRIKQQNYKGMNAE